MTNIEQQHDLVKNSLFQFINKQITGADLTVVDEIVLSYVISFLEEISQDPSFDVEGFTEMMTAYFPDFSSIDPALILSWIFQLEGELSSLTKDENPQHFSLHTLSLAELIPEEKLRGRTVSISDSGPEQLSTSAGAHMTNGTKRVQHLSETSDGGSTDSSNCDLFSIECEVLQEMFPESSFIEIKHCITIANGDIDRATQLVLHRQETGQSLQSNAIQLNKNQPKVEDHELKNRIIERYSYVDKVDQREYKPVAPKNEPKKLVRYRDNKIVSLKGERYTEMRNGDDDGELKKPKKQICP